MQFDQLKRREIITLLGGAAIVWPLAVRAQQPGMPVIGFIGITSAGEQPHWSTAFRQGLTNYDPAMCRVGKLMGSSTHFVNMRQASDCPR